MSTRLVPAQKIVSCDACGKDCDGSIRKMEARVLLSYNSLDYLGDAVVNGDKEYDFCDECFRRVTQAINVVIQEIQKK